VGPTGTFSLCRTKKVAVVHSVQPKLLQTDNCMAKRGGTENLKNAYAAISVPPRLPSDPRGAETLRMAHRALQIEPRFGLVAALAGVCHMRKFLFAIPPAPHSNRKECNSATSFGLSVDGDNPGPLETAALISAFTGRRLESEIDIGGPGRSTLNPNHIQRGPTRLGYYVAGCRRSGPKL